MGEEDKIEEVESDISSDEELEMANQKEEADSEGEMSDYEEKGTD
jgi:hypothetical protein